ncbi:hypothetical protein [Paenibacillus taiwanensis]|uniref:hypothetical protein n=1 Tax=Paenibacillus taiwanensis TaxID=401638 RepID=UPI0012FCC143|nr:hypothetical protein [Paenibacillus taiwanensis]
MQKLRLIVLSLLITVGGTVGLGMLASLGQKQQEVRNDVAVFTPSQSTITLDSDHIVDQLISSGYSLPIRRVQLSPDGRLSMDIKVSSSVQNANILYEELHHWMYFCFNETSNVNRLQLRIVLEDERLRKKHVLLAVDTLREEVTSERLQEIKHANGGISAETVRALRLTYTPLWLQKFSTPRR